MVFSQGLTFANLRKGFRKRSQKTGGFITGWSFSWRSIVSSACALTAGVPLSRLLVVLQLGFHCFGCFSSTPNFTRDFSLFVVLCSPGLVVSSPGVNQRDGTGLGNAFLACHSHVVQHKYSLQYRLLIDA